ncbi:MAG: sterol desaturase family protein [Nannocystaceae bacterium]|nr:sterol desaturase family protein [Nannocystaceae bacterium]
MAGQYLLFGGLVVGWLSWASEGVGQPAWLSAVQAKFAEQPLALQAAQAIVLGDLLMYVGHRLQHRVDFLWRFHAVHHTSERLDFLAAHREHPLDGLYTQTLMNLPAVALGLPIEQLLGLIVFRSLWAIFIHSNVRLSLGRLQVLLGGPALHHWHHANDRHAGNYANLAPWIDWFMGTYRCPPTEPQTLGLDGPHPRGYFALLLWPFIPRRIAGRLWSAGLHGRERFSGG